MLNTIAVMNTKGGVGKSTIVLALAETLSADHGKNVLVIDSDAQASVSSMLMTVTNLYTLQHEGRTIVDYLVASVLQGNTLDWSSFIVPKVSDVDDARSVYLLPSDMQLTLFEREVSKESRHTALRSTIGRLLAEVSNVFDIVLIDCPPGLSVLTESWLREADFHLSPTKADYVSICGLEVFRRFKALNPEMGFAHNLGVLVNLKDSTSETDVEYHKWLIESVDNRCFEPAIPRMGALQDAARYRTLDRSYAAKYPGAAGQSIRAVASELLRRLDTAKAAATGASLPPVVQPAPAAKPAVSSAGVAPAQPAAPQTTAAAAAARPVAMAAPAAPAASTAPNPPATATAKLASTPPAPPPPAASLAAAVAAVSASVPAKPATSPDKSELGAPSTHTPLRA